MEEQNFSSDLEKASIEDLDLKPTESMANNARRGLELRRKFGRGGTAVGVARARDLANRKELLATLEKALQPSPEQQQAQQMQQAQQHTLTNILDLIIQEIYK